MDTRTDRIIQVAIELAERDGYDAVRLRDLAAQADVALGTVYRRFSCKEDILAAALERQVATVRSLVEQGPIPGDSPAARLQGFFQTATDALAARPKLAAALLRTVASGVPELSERVSRYYDDMTHIIVCVHQGSSEHAPPQDDPLWLTARLLQNVWFGALVGWTGGLHGPDEVVRLTQHASELMLAGMPTAGNA